MSRSNVRFIFLFSLLMRLFISQTCGNAIQKEQIFNTKKVDRSIFNYSHNGVKISVRIIPELNDTSQFSRIENDSFPQFPFSEIGHCLIDLSLSCAQKRVARFLEIIGNLREITLFGQTVKLVKLKERPTDHLNEQRMLFDASTNIDRSIDDFFDTFALRITLPKWNRKRNQIDVMMDDTKTVEGRGGKGGGKGGGKVGKGGKGGGCKKMMMMMVMGLKMKMMGMIGMAAMKGMFMSGMSLMISKMMLLHQLMNKKGGIFGGFSGGSSSGGGSQGQLKEIVLLTKAGSGGSGTGGCGSGGGCSSSGGGSFSQDSYGAPPSNNAGNSGGYDYSGGGSGGGVSWGRSFNQRSTSFMKDFILRDNDQEPPVKRPKTDDNWSHEFTWNYMKKPRISKEIKSSQDIRKNQIPTNHKEFINENQSQPVYAIGWKNYEITRDKSTEN